MAGRYASTTSVPSERSRNEIESTLSRYGASAFMYGWDPNQAIIQFSAEGRHIRFVLPLPDRADFQRTPERGLQRTAAQVEAAYEQAVRQRWRALLLIVKAKLEAVESGITEFEDEFLAHIVLPSGETAGVWLRPQIAEAYLTGAMPAGLLALPPGPR